MRPMAEHCAICGCELHRARDTYASPTIEGRSSATKHHFVAERFFGRSSNRRGTKTEGIFSTCRWGHEGKSDVFCYECHEVLLHNPVLLPEDVARFAELVWMRNLAGKSETCGSFKDRRSCCSIPRGDYAWVETPARKRNRAGQVTWRKVEHWRA